MKTKYLFFLAFTLLLTLLSWGTLIDRQIPPNFATGVRQISALDYQIDGGDSGSVSLPSKIANLPPRTAVNLYSKVTIQKNESLYIKTVYAPLRLYANNRLIYESGQSGSYPAFLLDPPTIVTTVPLADLAGEVQLRFEYLSPTQRNTLMLPAVFIGNEASLLLPIFAENGFSLLFSSILLCIGTFMTLLSSVLMRKEPSIAAFLWLGLFAVACGIWGLGECDLTAFFIPYPSLLYLMAFIGLFTMTIPLLHFGLLILNLHHKMPLKIMLAIMKVSVIIALSLQLAGIVGLSRSMHVFHVLVPLSLSVFVVCILWEGIRYKNAIARRFSLPMFLLTLSALLELFNYQMRFTNILSLFFQIGTLCFVISLAIIGAHFIHEAFLTNTAKMRLEFEVSLMERQLDAQKLQYQTLTANAEAVKEQRHDLRHQLTVIKHYSDLGETEKLSDYIDELIAKIPVDHHMTVCTNFAVNALAVYYLSLAKSAGIELDTKLVIPDQVGRVQDSDLCIIIGNLLENALEACKRATNQPCFIHLYSRVQHDALIIVMDNSFDGQAKQQEGIFLSSKRDGKGTGLSSVQAVAKKYDGIAKFTVKDTVFMSSIYVKM